VATNSDRRLGRLYGALTPQERAVLVLRAWKEGREPARQLLTSSTLEDAHEYNRLIDLLCVASDELTQYLTIVHLYVEQLEVKTSWYLTALLWGLAEPTPEQVERAEELADVLRDGLVEEIAVRWRELEALEVVLAEIAEEVDREDVLHPEARALFDQTKKQLLALKEEIMGRGVTCVLDPPSPEQVEALRRAVARKPA
jgi:hypothetical protein